MKTLRKALGPSDWTTLAGLAALTVIAGIWTISGAAATWFPALAVPSALGLSSPVPPLRVMPLGETTWTFWAANTVGAGVMILAAWLQLRAVSARRPNAGPGRALGRAVWTSILAIAAGNVVRGVFISVAADSGFGTFVGQMLGGLLVSVIAGVVCGVVIGVVAAIVAGVGHSRDDAPTVLSH